MFVQPTISLVDFYAALRNQEVESVEFDGAMYEVSAKSPAHRITIMFIADLTKVYIRCSVRT